MFINIFKKAYSLISEIKKNNNININLTSLNPKLEAVISGISKTPEKYACITKDSLLKAKNLVDYFNKVKLCLAEYTNIDYSQEFLLILKSLSGKKQFSDSKFTKKFSEISKKILLFVPKDSKTDQFTANNINQILSSNYRIEDVLDVSLELQNFGLINLQKKKDERQGGRVLKFPFGCCH